jgi:hypothetical protein
MNPKVGEVVDQCMSFMATGGQCDLDAEPAHEVHQKQYPGRLVKWTAEGQQRVMDEQGSRFD